MGEMILNNLHIINIVIIAIVIVIVIVKKDDLLGGFLPDCFFVENVLFHATWS